MLNSEMGYFEPPHWEHPINAKTIKTNQLKSMLKYNYASQEKPHKT